jgi:hypothetical protein
MYQITCGQEPRKEGVSPQYIHVCSAIGLPGKTGVFREYDIECPLETVLILVLLFFQLMIDTSQFTQFIELQ